MHCKNTLNQGYGIARAKSYIISEPYYLYIIHAIINWRERAFLSIASTHATHNHLHHATFLGCRTLL